MQCSQYIKWVFLSFFFHFGMKHIEIDSLIKQYFIWLCFPYAYTPFNIAFTHIAHNVQLQCNQVTILLGSDL